MSKEDTNTFGLPLVLNEDETGLLNLIDKYIKANNNFLPLQAYLNYLEQNIFDSFLPVSYSLLNQTVYNTKYGPINTNSSTLVTITNETNDSIQIAQKLYKFIISIDYSPQVTNLDFIQKGLETIFEKIKEEYDQFSETINLEPQIYVTVLLWNSAYFQYRQNSQLFNSYLNDDFIPFTTIFHAKRLLKSNLVEITNYIFEKVNEAKSIFLTLFKTNQQKQQQHLLNDVSSKILKPVDQHQSKSAPNNKEIGSLERLLTHIIKIFSFFNVNNTATSTSAPTALSSAHHIYISDGLFYANDMIKCLEKISKSSITFSFICSGSSNSSHKYHTANNISSSFGYVADHYLMKFIAQISNGFYAVIDENSDSHFIHKKKLLLYAILSKQNQKFIDLSADTLIDNTTNTNSNSEDEKPISQTNNLCCNDRNYENYFFYKETIRTHATSTQHRFSNNKTNSKQIIKEDEKFEIKCIHKYELSSNVHSILQLTRFRTQEGFYLVHITRQQINSKLDLLTLHFKRNFTQTTILFYKLSYFLNTCKTCNSKETSALMATSPTKWSTNQDNDSDLNQDKFLVEIWLSWNFLHLKAKYQNLVLIQQLRHTLHHIQKLDFDKSFNLTSSMLHPPDLLRLKEPLFKLVANNADSNDLKNTKLIMQNYSFEINIRHKAMESEFTSFANPWLPIAFFKYNTNTLAKHFAVHTLKLILDHDRLPSPDIYTNIFNLKQDQQHQHQQQQQLHQQYTQPHEQAYDNHDIVHVINYYDNAFSYYNLNPHIHIQINQSTTNNSNNSNNTNSTNNNSLNIFQCRNSLNKLCVMLIDWCDLILVENCVFLKYLKASQSPTSEKVESEKQKHDDEITQPLMENQVQNETNESFVIIKLDTSCVPYVALQYLFHSSINYLDRMRLIQKFKEKLKVLNLKNLDTETSSIQMASAGMTTPPPPSVIITPPQQTSTLNKLLQPGMSSPSSFKYNSNLVLNQTETNISSLTSKLKKRQQECCCILLQKPDLFDMILSHFSKMNNQNFQIDNTNKKSAHLQTWQQNPSQVLNFMLQKKYKWVINKTFSVPISLSLKENIIDMFVRSRLREGFKCLFQSNRLAVFTIQLNMFDQGGLSTQSANTNPSENNNRKSTISETDASTASATPPSYASKVKEGTNLNFKSGSSQFCTFVYVIYFMNNSNIYYNQSRLSKNECMINMDRKLAEQADKLDQNEILTSLVSNYDESIYFTTEIYSEVIDGVYQDKKQTLLTDNKRTTTDYFRNLTYLEIINLIFLIDLKSFLTMQSVSALFLNKSNAIINLYNLLNTVELIQSNESNQTPLPKNSNNLFFTQETTSKILTCNSNFYESIRMLPDLNLLSKSLQQINQTNPNASRLNSVNEAPTGTGYIYKRIRPQPIELDSKISVSPSAPPKSSLIDSTNDSKEASITITKKKKTDSISLHEQLKPVLNSLFSVNASATIPRDIININFQFSFRNVLLESNLFMSVFEDIPFNLFNTKLNQANSFELNSVYKIQKMFFANLDENFKRTDPNTATNFLSAPIPRTQHNNRGSTASVEDLENKTQQFIIDHVKKELKNTICLRLNEIKSGDVIVKQIIENLNASELEMEGRSFHYYFRFNIACATSTEVNYGQIKWARNANTEQEQSNTENDNRFFIFGLFFLNFANNEQSLASNRLVFFMFDCMPDSVKKSIVNVNSNTYLIRKSLFSAQKISNNRSQTESNKLAFSDTYRFYCNKNAELLRQATTTSATTSNSTRTKTYSSDHLMHRNSTIPNLTNTTPSNFMKKVFSISDILKLNLNNLSTDTVFTNYIDFIEENCAKSYIESVIHYLGLHSSTNLHMLHKSISDDKRVKFEVNSIKQMLKIGRKIKLVDVDLTDYLKQICSHLKTKADTDTLLSREKCSVQNQYLEKKFNDLFLRKFNQIPGFNDLFIFTPNQLFKTKQRHDEQISSIDHSFDNGTLPSHKTRRKRIMRKSNSRKRSKQIRIDSDVQTFSQSLLSTLKSTTQSSDSLKQLIEKELNESMNKSLDDLYGTNMNTDDDEYDYLYHSDDYDDDDYNDNGYDNIYSDNDNTSDTNDNSYIENKIDNKNLLTVHSTTTTEEDATTDMDDEMLHMRKNTNRIRRKTSKFRSSSPFSNSSVILNKNFDPVKNKEINPLACTTTNNKPDRSVDEQIISIEFVCIIGNDADDNTLMPGLIQIDTLRNNNNNGSATDLDVEARKTTRVRTTTLTPDYSNTNNTDSLLTTTGLDSSGASNLDSKTLSEPTQQMIENEQLPNPFKTSNRRSLFFSKFNKFNLQCLLDLIEEKDQNEFNQLVKNLESESSEYYNESNRDVFNLGNNIKVYLRFNWYSFNELNLNFGSTSSQQQANMASNSKLLSQQTNAFVNKNLLQRPMYQSGITDANNLLLQKTTNVTSSVHSSSSTVYNSMNNVAASNANPNAKFLNRNYQFEYYHLLNPILNEFKWHLRDEIFQFEQSKIKHLLVFISHMSHVREGVRRKYSHCRLSKRKIIMNKTTTTFYTTQVDAKPKTIASKLLSVNHLREQQQQQTSSASNKPATKTMKHVDEDKSILSVDPKIFLAELILLVKNLTGKFYDCQLQQVHEYFYYLNCNLNNNNKRNIMLDENLNYTFKILIHLHNSSSKRNLTNNQIKNDNKQVQQLQQPIQNITNQEIIINQIKIKIYYSFNHTSFQNREDLIDYLIIQFNHLLNKLIKSVYLSLMLKEIHDSRKWNNLLQLVDTPEESKKELKTNKSSSSLATNIDPNDSVLTIKNNTIQGSLACNCVWSVKFKLHRLHQTVQKIHGSTEITPSTPSVLQQQQLSSSTNLQSQQYISQGLKKLQEFLVNFKIEESSKCGDLYVYTRKDEIFLLKLEEIYEQQSVLNQTTLNNPVDVENSLAYDNSVDLGASYAKQQQSTNKTGSLLSRRPSYASIHDTDLTYKTNQLQQTNLPVGKTQNLSGGSITNANANPSQASNLNTTTPSTLLAQQQSQQLRSNPEYIKLSVYGLTEPDEEMKQDLCKTLQSELDCWLLNKMCNSIEKNTFKTTSLQHPDKITDEDLTFFKSISDNYFDFEIPLPFIFNFNKQMRENFFYFIKNIFNNQFKAIEAPMPTCNHSASNQFLSSSGQFRKSFSMRAKSSQTPTSTTTSNNNNIESSRANETETENEYDELANLIYNDASSTIGDHSVLSSTVKTSTQTVSSMFHSQQLSFSFMSIQPQLGPYSTNKTSSLDGSISKPNLSSTNKRITELDPFMILLTRILFLNSKNIRIGKHAVSLALVEALYAIKSLDVLVLSRVTRSNSIGANTVITPSNKSNQNQNNQVLETSYTQSKLTGPTFVFRFYCKGENDTNAYKASLKSALNDALLYFFSEYITRIEPDYYLRKIRLNKVPAQFRKFRFQIDKITNAVTTQKSEKKTKKRHKSTGNCGDDNTNENVEELSLYMNKTAINTNLGKLITKQHINTESQFNLFTLNNFNNNLFDNHDYEDTIEYFRESIRAFDYNRILNSFVNDANNSSSLLLSSSSASASSIENENEDYSSDVSNECESESESDSSDSESDSVDDLTQTTMMNNSELNQSSVFTDTTPTLSNEPKKESKSDKTKSTIAFKKSHLRFIYEWLKGLYFVQLRAGTNLCSRSVGSINLKSQQQHQQQTQPRSNQPQPTNLLTSSLIISPLQQQSGSSPSNLGGSLANIISGASGHQSFGQFILRKKFSYKTKYNLTSLLREVESGLRDSCKSNEITVNYFSFTNQNVKKRKLSEPKKTAKQTETPAVITTESTETNQLKSCLRNSAETQSSSNQQKQQQSKRADYYASCFNLDDNEFGNDFKNLKQTKFANLHSNLSRLENLIITMNVEYCLPTIAPSNSSVNVFAQQHTLQQTNANINIAPGSSLSSSSSNNSSSNTISQVPTYARIPSYSGVTSNKNNPLQQFDQQPNLASNIMTKSINSNSGVDLFDLSISNTFTALQLKRTYLYALCNARTKMITFYIFTTESGCHEQLRQLLDNCCEICLQRYHLVNNTVLYKYGGLIGDSMINDLKKVKHLTSLAVSTSCNNTNKTTKTNSEPITNESSDLNKPKPSPINLPQNSPKLYRQFSYKMSNDSKYPQPINTSLISNLTPQFGGTTTSQASTVSSTTSSTQQLNLPFKQLSIAQTSFKSFDSIINIVNYQVNFCQQYLTNSPISFNDAHSMIPVNLNSTLSHSSSYALLTQSNTLVRQTSMINPSINSNLNLQQSILTPNRISFANFSPIFTLYGVGLNYQLYELQQVYRHPKKIYELALTLVNHSPQQQPHNVSIIKPSSNTSSSQILSKSSQLLTVSEFYKNYIVPVLVPFHFCCSPILFSSKWNEQIINEQTLRTKNIENKANIMQQSSSSNSSGTFNKSITSTQQQHHLPQQSVICNDAWYQKMRQIFLIEYTRYFEGRGFLRLRDDSKETTSNTSKSISNETQTQHFIKWIQHDGFIYITVNLDEVLVNIKLGYCTRYRMASRSFLSDLVKFFAQDFHVHSLTYDLHLLAINRNLTSSSWTSPKHMSLTISKFLDEFVEFFSRVPLFSSNKVFKVIFERTDYSVQPHKFGLIFDFMMFAKKKLNKLGQFNTLLFTPLDVNLENNIGIYTISNQKPDSFSKYLVIKIESFTTNSAITQTTTPALTQSTISSTSSVSNKKQISKTDSMHSSKLALNKPTIQPQQIKLSTSSSSSSLINQRTLTSENSFSNLNQMQQSQLIRQNSIQQPLTQQHSAHKTNSKSNQFKHDAHIRLVCYYLCINKQSTQFTDQRNASTNLFSKDLEFIDKILEESINVYKLETFWYNLMISMSSITDYLNESSTGNSVQSSVPITFSIESDELEQVLNHSQKLDALDLDPSLFSFLQECYSIKNKIRTSFEFSFGRHFIFTSSDTVDYCLLLINDNLIKKFRCTVSSSIHQQQQSNNPISLTSFVLSDRILHSSASSPCSLSSSNSSTTKASSSSSDSNSDKQLNSFVLLKFDKTYKMTYLWQINRIVQQEFSESILPSSTTNNNNATSFSSLSTTITATTNYNNNNITNLNMPTTTSLSSIKNSKISSNKYLSFTINNLMYVLWEGLFSN